MRKDCGWDFRIKGAIQFLRRPDRDSCGFDLARRWWKSSASKPLRESGVLSFGEGLHIGSHKYEIRIYQKSEIIFKQLGFRIPRRLLLVVV